MFINIMKSITLITNQLNKMLTSKVMLYIALFVSLTNIVSYIALGDLVSVLVFIVVGIITNHYTGNMIIVLLLPLVLTNLLFLTDRTLKLRETMVENMSDDKTENKNKKTKQTGSEDKDNKRDDVDEADESDNINKKSTNTNDDTLDLKPKNKKSSDKKLTTKTKNNKKNKDEDINENETYEAFFKGISGQLSSESIEKMTNQTNKLIESQQKLKNAMGQLSPMVDNAKAMMKNLGDMGNLIGFEGFDSKTMNTSVKNIMNKFMNISSVE
jgi:E3 ubiquitin-protein ligase DOA10